MSTILRYLEFLSLATWVGGIIFVSFVVAPGAFATLSNRQEAGALVGMALGRLHWIGVAAGVIYLLARMAEMRSVGTLFKPAAGLVVLMVALTAYSQLGVTSKMAGLREQMGSLEATPATSPLRAEFDRLHKWSVRIEGTVLICGLAAMFLTVKDKSA